MQIEVGTRRREVLMLVLTAVLLGFFVEFLAGVVLHVTDRLGVRAQGSIAGGGVLCFLLVAYFVVLSRREKTIVTAQFVFSFNRDECVFVDIPRCPPSVHARVQFNRLSEARRRELAAFDRWDKFFGSEFEHFVNEGVQAMLLDLLIQENVSDAPKAELYKFQQLPESLKQNGCLRREAEALPDNQYRIPRGVELRTFGPYERFLKFSSSYGTITLSWTLRWGNTAFEAEAAAALKGASTEKAVHDLAVDINMVQDFRFIYMHSRKLDEFAAWSLLIRRTLEDIDWRHTVQLMPLVLLAEVLRVLKGEKR